MDNNKQVQMVLASSSKIFMEGIYKVLEDKCKLKIVAKAGSCEEVENSFQKKKPEFLLLDNRSNQMDLVNLLDLISRKSPTTKVILLNGHNKIRVMTSISHKKCGK